MDDIVQRLSLDLSQFIAGHVLGRRIHVNALLPLIHDEKTDSGVIAYRLKQSRSFRARYDIILILQRMPPDSCLFSTAKRG